MNEGIADGRPVDGVLVDRTADYAGTSDVPGDQGFLTPTNDRDVILVDVDLDGWLDVVTAVTLSDGDPKHIKFPRVYMNLGEDGDGRWLGLRHEDARIPDFSPAEPPDAAPRFNAVAGGDLNGDDAPDLYFVDSDSGPTFQLYDYNNIVLLNDGRGFFTEATQAVLPTQEMTESAMGTAAEIRDFNNDGANDIMKATTLNPPAHLAITYSDPDAPGTMTAYQIAYADGAYHASADDLNNDGLLDMIFVSAGTDHAIINTGIDARGIAQFSETPPLLLASGVAEGTFGGNSVIGDLDGDGWKDVIVTDADIDIPGCARTTCIYRNDAAGVGAVVTLQEAAVPPIPEQQRKGVHDAAIFDLNGDGRNDIVLGRCNSTGIWIQRMPPCPADLSGNDGVVNVADLLVMLNFWGDAGASAALAPPTDVTDIADLLELLAAWGECPA